MPHHHGIHHRISIPLEVVLAQYRQTLARSQHDRPRCRVQIARNSTQESRLSGTVGTDYTITITTCKLQVYIIKQHSFTKLNRYVRDCNHLYIYCFIMYYLQFNTYNSANCGYKDTK